MRVILALLAWAALLAPSAALAQAKSDWEREQGKHNWRDADVSLPGFPRAGDLIEFAVSSAGTFTFFLDRASLSVSPDGVVRYTLLARSPSGVDNVSYEGIRCSTGEYRIYAIGHRDGTWSRREQPWQRIEPKSVKRWHYVLQREYFCPRALPISSAAEGVDALRRGRHPKVDLSLE
jgi:hypothetical protein